MIDDLLAGRPRPWPADLLPAIRDASTGRPLLVLDDDPTGTQSLGRSEVILGWDRALVADALAQGDFAYVITNSRSFAPAWVRDELATIAGELGGLGLRGPTASLVSRSDSTLRGHFPLETDLLAGADGWADARIVLAPYLGEAGRVTIGGIHYVLGPDGARPVGETEFARDATFGFRSSRLDDWVAERAGRARAVRSLELDAIRAEGPAAVASALRDLPPSGVLAVDAVDDRDIEVVALGTLGAERAGVPVIARTAASYVRARLGRGRAELIPLDPSGDAGPGLIVVGSHTGSASRQLEGLSQALGAALAVVELDATPARQGAIPRAAIQQAARALDAGLADGRHALLHTSRTVVREDDPTLSLEIAARVSAGVVAAVAEVRAAPGWVVVKGGITSYDVCRSALAMRRASVLGPALPGIPVWSAPVESRWPGIQVVVVPGNVGGDDTLIRLVRGLAG